MCLKNFKDKIGFSWTFRDFVRKKTYQHIPKRNLTSFTTLGDIPLICFHWSVRPFFFIFFRSLFKLSHVTFKIRWRSPSWRPAVTTTSRISGWSSTTPPGGPSLTQILMEGRQGLGGKEVAENFGVASSKHISHHFISFLYTIIINIMGYSWLLLLSLLSIVIYYHYCCCCNYYISYYHYDQYVGYKWIIVYEYNVAIAYRFSLSMFRRRMLNKQTRVIHFWRDIQHFVGEDHSCSLTSLRTWASCILKYLIHVPFQPHQDSCIITIQITPRTATRDIRSRTMRALGVNWQKTQKGHESWKDCHGLSDLKDLFCFNG